MNRRISIVIVGSVLLGGLAAVMNPPADAAVHEHMLDMGQKMAAYLDDGGTVEEPRLMHLNGQQLYFAIGYTQDSVDQVLDFYQQRYADAENRLAKAMGMKDAPPAPAPIRASDGERGFVAMHEWNVDPQMQSAKQPEQLAEWRARLSRAAATGRIYDIGVFRYVYAYRAGEGTRFVMVWPSTDSRVPTAASDAGDDAPGFDLVDVPRPPGAKRLLSAREAGQLHKTLAYSVPSNTASAEAFYRDAMVKAGWSADAKHDRALAASTGVRSLFFVKAGHEAWISIGQATPGEARVTIVAR